MKPKLRSNGPPSKTLPPSLHSLIPDPELDDEDLELVPVDRSPSRRNRARHPAARTSDRDHDTEHFDTGRGFSPDPLDTTSRREFSPGPVDDRFRREFSPRVSRSEFRRGFSPELAINHLRRELSPRLSSSSSRRQIDPEFDNHSPERKFSRRYSKFSDSPVRFSPELLQEFSGPSRSPHFWETSPERMKFSLDLLEELARPEYTSPISSDCGPLNDDVEHSRISRGITGPSRCYGSFHRGGPSPPRIGGLGSGRSSPRLEPFNPRSHSRQSNYNTEPRSVSRARKQSISVCHRQDSDPIGNLGESSAVDVFSQVGQRSWRDDLSPQHGREFGREKHVLRMRECIAELLTPGHHRGITPVRRDRRSISPVRRDRRSISPVRRDRRSISPVRRDRRSISPVRRDRRSISPIRRDRRSISPVRRDRRSISPVRRDRRNITPPIRRDRRSISPVRRDRRGITPPVRRDRRSISPVRRDRRTISPGNRERRSITPGRRSRRPITPDRRQRRSRDRCSVSDDRGRRSATKSSRSRPESPYTVFKREDGFLIEHMEKMKAYFKKYPSTHPEYTEEWTKFYKRRRQELQQKNIAIADHDLTPEWDVAWVAKVDELAEAHLALERKGLREKHGLRAEEPPVSAKSVEKAAANFDQTKKIMQFIVTAAATANKPKKDDVTNPRESSSNPSSFKFTVISTLKLLNELDSHLDHLGPSISSLLFTAVRGNITKSDPLSIFKDVANINLVETAMQKIVLAMMKPNRNSDLDSSGSVCIQSVRWLLNEVFREHFAGIDIIQTASETRNCSLNIIAQKIARQLLKAEGQRADADTLHSVLQSITKLHELRPIQSTVDSIMKSVTISSVLSSIDFSRTNAYSSISLPPVTYPPHQRSSALPSQGSSQYALPSTSSLSNPPLPLPSLNQPPPSFLPSQASFPPPGPVPGPSSSSAYGSGGFDSQQLPPRQPLATVPPHQYREGVQPLSESRSRAPFTVPPPGYQSGFGITYPPPPSHYR